MTLVYDFIDEKGASVIGAWIHSENLSKRDIAAFKEKVGLLKQYGPDLPSGLLAGPIYKNIYKLRVNTAERALRPLLCKGPSDNEKEFTLLLGAIEVNSVLQPEDAAERADKNRTVLLANPNRRQKR